MLVLDATQLRSTPDSFHRLQKIAIAIFQVQDEENFTSARFPDFSPRA
jgi:hypothetical protein